MSKYPILSFNAGELSPMIDARSDVDKYHMGCRTLENMIPRIYGPALRRPGTKYIETCNGVARVIPFIYSEEIAYVVLMEEGRMWFYYDGGEVLDASGGRLGIDTPYTAADLFEIQYKQSNDVLWLTHGGYPPMKLSRTSANSFTLTAITFDNGPFKKRHDLEYDDGVTLTPNATQSVATDDISDEAVSYFASSEMNSSMGAAKAFDGRFAGAGSYWQTKPGDYRYQYVGCQFSTTRTVKQVRIAPYGMWPSIQGGVPWSYNPRHIRIDASNDGTTWTKIPIDGWSGNCSVYQSDEAELGKIQTPGEWVQLTLDNSTGYTYWRVYVYDIWGPVDPEWWIFLWLITSVVRLGEIEFIESTTSWGTDVTLTASEAVFDEDHVGALFSLTQQRVNTNLTGSMTAPTTGTTTSLMVEGSFTFTTHGTWTGTISLERTIDGTLWETLRKWTSCADMNVQYTGSEEESNVYYRINVSSLSANTAPGTAGVTSTVRYDLTVNSSTQTGICRVTGYTSATEVSVTVLTPFASTEATERWAEGSWSAYRGYPRCVTFFQNRCIYAGTDHQPQTVWISGTDDYEDFAECTKDNSAFSLTMSSDTQNAIQWISALDAVIVGTSGGEWVLSAGGNDPVLKPSNFDFKQQTTYGSKAIQALPVNDAVLMVDRVGRRVREITYDDGKAKYVAPDLCALAEHVTESGITTIAYQKNPDPILWSTRTDGTLLSMTYEREQNVVAWSRHPLKTAQADYMRQYPTLQALSALDIPDEPDIPADIILSNPIVVTTAAGLQAMAVGHHYSIESDIDMAGESWTPLNLATAGEMVIEGNNHTISNMTMSTGLADIEGTQEYVALIGKVNNADLTVHIRNLSFDDCTVTGADSLGVVFGWIQKCDQIVVRNVTVNRPTIIGVPVPEGTTDAYERYGYGGIVGFIRQGALYCKDCTVNDITISNTYNESTGDVIDCWYVGGFIGGIDAVNDMDAVESHFVDCAVDGCTITVGGWELFCIGGFCGGSDRVTSVQVDVLGGHYYNCSATDVAIVGRGGKDTFWIGGFMGYIWEGDCTSCTATGSVDITGVPIYYPGSYWDSALVYGIGGFVGRVAGDYSGHKIVNCTADVDLILTSLDDPTYENHGYIVDAGGFVGSVATFGEVLGCSSSGSITVTGYNEYFSDFGGFVGSTYDEDTVSISRCSATGDLTFNVSTVEYYVTIPNFAGGLSGVGGFYGAVGSGPTIEDCYCWGSIQATVTPVAQSCLCGFGGESWGATSLSVKRCYCAQTDTKYGNRYTDQITPFSWSRGFILEQRFLGTCEDSFWDQETAGITPDGHTLPYFPHAWLGDDHTTEWMQTKTNYEDAGWNFSTIWYMSEEGVYANSVAVVPGETEDEVWLIVNRFINGSDVYYLEQMQPRDVDDQEDMWFVDCGLALETADADGIVSGLGHLEGEEVAILVDGGVQPRQTVVSGSVNVGCPILRKAIVGLPFRYTLQPMRFDLAVDGSTKGTIKSAKEVVISFYRTLNAKYGVDVDHLFNIDWRTEEAYGSPPALYTGDKVVAHEGGFSVEDPFIVAGDDPLPCTVRAIIPRVEVFGR